MSKTVFVNIQRSHYKYFKENYLKTCTLKITKKIMKYLKDMYISNKNYPSFVINSFYGFTLL